MLFIILYAITYIVFFIFTFKVKELETYLLLLKSKILIY
jgi:hypothetical protein